MNSRVPLVVSLVAGAFLFVPIYYLLTAVSSAQAFAVFSSSDTVSIIANTFEYAGGAAILATGLAVAYSWIVHRTNIPWKRFFDLLPVIAITVPVLVRMYAWIFLFSPNIGFFNDLLATIGLPRFLNIFSFWGMWFSAATGGMAITYLVISPAIKSMDPSIEEASRTMGYGLLRTFFRVTMRVLLPAIFSAFLLSLIDNVDLFDVPFILGTPARLHFLATEVFYYTDEAVPAKDDVAAALGVIYLILALALVSIYIYATRRTGRFAVITGKQGQQTFHRLSSGWKYLALLFCLTIFFLGYVLPVGTIAFMSFSRNGLLSNFSFNLDSYAAALTIPNYWEGFYNSAVFAIVAAIVGTTLAIFMSYTALKSGLRGSRLVDYMSNIPLGFPAIVFGFALFLTFLFAPGVSIIYGTILPMIIALAFLKLPHATRMIGGNLVQIAKELEEASRVLGAGWWRTFRRVVLPLVKSAIINSITYLFLFAYRELGGVIILVTGNTPLLIILLLNSYEASSRLNILSAASIIMTVTMVLFLVAFKVAGRFLGRGARGF